MALKTVEIDERCPNRIWQMLEGIADQVAKEQYLNASLRAVELQAELLRRFGQLLKGVK